MLRYGNRGKRGGKRKVRKSSSICLKLVDGSVCRKSPAESVNGQQNYIIHWTHDVNSGGSEPERPQ
jgi:hypothetical protein